MKYIDEIWLNNNISQDSYLNELAFIDDLKKAKRIKLDDNVTFFVGENGSGKSTLLEAIALQCGLNAEGGSKNFNFSTADSTDTELSNCITISKIAYPKDSFFLRSESFFNVATQILELGVTGYGNKALHKQSHGESFLSLFQNRFRGNGLYILDEPEAALSPSSILAIIYYIKQLVDKKSQFIIATHSPILLAYPNASIFELSDRGIHKITYRESELYNTYKTMLDNPEGVIRQILE